MSTNSTSRALLPENLSHTTGVTAKQLITILWDYKIFITACVFAMVILAILATLLMPKRYISTAMLEIDFQVYDPATGKDFPAFLAASYMSTEVEIVVSRETLARAAESLGWPSDPDKTEGFDSSTHASLRDYLAYNLSKGLQVSQFKDSRLIMISYEAKSPLEAAIVANAVAESYLQRQLARTSEPTRQRAKEYEKTLAELRSKVNSAQAELTQFRQQSGLLDLDQKVDVEAQRLLELTNQLAQVQALKRDADSRLNHSGKNFDTQVATSPVINNLRTELALAESRFSQAAENLGPRHPDYRALETEISTLKKQLNGLLAQAKNAIRTESRVANDSEEKLIDEIERQRQIVLETRRKADEASKYQRELQSANQVYNAALSGYDQLVIGSESRYSNASIANPATPPLEKSFPKGKLNVILGVFLGGMLGVMLSLLSEFRTRLIRCTDDIERDFGLVILGEA